MGGRGTKVAALAWLLVAACGGGGAGIDGGGDTVDATFADAPPSCGVTWKRVAVPVTELLLLDPAPLNGARTTRVVATVELGPCEELAMPVLSWTFEAEEVFIDMVAWRPLGGDCAEPSQLVRRPVSLELYQGTWMVHAGGESLVVDVGPAPDRACNPAAAPCQMDCDCADGEKCLGGNGFVGPFTACATPCELDRDCGGAGQCISATDGLDFYCDLGPECDTGRPCAPGYDCSAGACVAQTQLGQGTRIGCACDADCAPPLRCVEADYAGRYRRCEIACPTAGPWCTGPHFCGGAFQDLAELAPADSVCVFAGE